MLQLGCSCYVNANFKFNYICSDREHQENKIPCSPKDVVVNNKPKHPLNFSAMQNNTTQSDVRQKITSCASPGKKICLNRLPFMNSVSLASSTVISLRELLHPIDSITRIFIATFTSDILW